MMEIKLRYFDGCPNRKATAEHLARLTEEGSTISVSDEVMDTHDPAVALGFRGSAPSPTTTHRRGRAVVPIKPRWTRRIAMTLPTAPGDRQEDGKNLTW